MLIYIVHRRRKTSNALAVAPQLILDNQSQRNACLMFNMHKYINDNEIYSHKVATFPQFHNELIAG